MHSGWMASDKANAAVLSPYAPALCGSRYKVCSGRTLDRMRVAAIVADADHT